MGLGLIAAAPRMARAADVGELVKTTSNPPKSSTSYRLVANDVIEVKVYQEDDLQTKLRVAKDGTATFPLIGNVQLAGKTVDEAAADLRTLLGKDFLVNPQVTLTIVEYAKRRFTVLGQVQKPGTFEIPSEESVSLLGAIAMAGGYTRLANSTKVSVTRLKDGKRVTYLLDAKLASNEGDGKPFEILPDDTINVAERVF
jgi:protein involved in polysaccharide export with SLBB domain